MCRREGKNGVRWGKISVRWGRGGLEVKYNGEKRDVESGDAFSRAWEHVCESGGGGLPGRGGGEQWGQCLSAVGGRDSTGKYGARGSAPTEYKSD